MEHFRLLLILSIFPTNSTISDKNEIYFSSKYFNFSINISEDNSFIESCKSINLFEFSFTSL